MNEYLLGALIFLGGIIIGIFYNYNWIAYIVGLLERRKLINFAENEVHSAIILGDIGKGKTLLMSIICRGIKNGIKKAGFVNNIRDAELLSYSDINLYEPKEIKDTYRVPKYYFLDEANLYIRGNDYKSARQYHKGVSHFLAFSRHLGVRLWMTAQRGGQVWIEMREIVNYYVKLGKMKNLFDIGEKRYFTLPVEFYNQSFQLEKEFNILVSSLDFNLYDSYWVKDISHFLPVKPNAINNNWVKK